MDAAISQALKRLEELAAKGAIDANQLKVRQDQLRQQDRVAKLAAVSGCYIGKEGKPVAASATTGMASLDHDVLQHMLSFVRSYPRCVLLATTSKQLQPLLQGKPLSDRARDAPGELVMDLVVQAMKDQGLSRAAEKRLSLVAEKFPDALDQRHWPPLSLDDFPQPPGKKRYRRVFLSRHGDEELGHRLFEQEYEEWHGKLPNKPITPLELSVSVQSPWAMEIMDALLELGAKPTELAITIDMGNANAMDGRGAFTPTLLKENPSLVSTSTYDLDWIHRENIFPVSGSKWIREVENFVEYLITRCGVVPEVGVTHSAGGNFSHYYDDDTIANLLRMAQATQVCTKCNAPKTRDDFEQEEWEWAGDTRLCRTCNVRACRKCGASKARADFEEPEWEREGDERLCRVCNVRDCCKCGASKGRSEFSSVQWDCATGRECRTCNVRACSRCGRSKDPYHFPDEGEWEKNDRLCRSCKLPPSKRRSCAQCSTSLPQSDFSKKQWGKAANGKGRCKKCLGN
ncbi:unnamed protein product [Pelagomonas calceolata]|uniref:Uncharacterized protein n=1 Tax=Pelagomonas calceolata TaxID=35677 RepID=A0A7S4A7I5_9STRA|nr:unnamed protein product [Pelagomonas calceolata]|mmetsp:Transcript_1833/g.5377  ORF Transcript_1833/g.5377 Transcript_1833/m.5377 type:complete len:515 (+) Transcript_1833:115-1659(+)